MEEARSTCTWCDQERRHLSEWYQVREPQVHKRIILAHLVHGMYQRARRLAGYKQCWETHGYVLVPLENILTLEDKKQCSSTYGSAFRYLEREKRKRYFGVLRRTETRGLASDAIAPEWVVVIRGTIPTRLQDLKEDVKISLELLNTSSTIKLLKLVVSRLIKDKVDGDASKVAITGHSLGASIGMLVARGMALQDDHTDSHFFNPPFATLSYLVDKFVSGFLHFVVDSVVRKNIQNKLRSLKCTVIKIYNGVVNGGTRLQTEEKEHLELRKWAPHLYLNKNDLICNGYIDYFSRRWRTSDLIDSYHNFGSSLFPGITQTFHFLPRATGFISAVQPAHNLENWIKSSLPVEVQNYETPTQVQDDPAVGKENFSRLSRSSPEGDTECGYGSYSKNEDDSWVSESSACDHEADDSWDEDEEVDSFSEGVEVDSDFKVDGSGGEELPPATLQTILLLKMVSLSKGVEFDLTNAHSGGTEDSQATRRTRRLLDMCAEAEMYGSNGGLSADPSESAVIDRTREMLKNM